MNRVERHPYRLVRIALMAMALVPTVARADGSEAVEDPDTPTFSFSGFGTVSVVHSNEDKADFTSDTTKDNGAGYTDKWSAAVDSLVGGQVTTTITPRLSAILQVIAEQKYEGSYTPHVEWANVKYEVTTDLGIRAGRIRLPGLLLSDTRKVAYSYLWVRPPVEVYSVTPISYSDGVDVSYRVHVGNYTNTLQGNFGRAEPKFPGDYGSVEARNLWGFSDTVEYGALTARITYQVTDLTLPALGTLFDQFRQFGPEGIAIADNYEPADKRARFLGVGASLDTGQWFATGEWGTTDTDSILGEKTGWYVGGGYRIDNFTPFLTYSSLRGEGAGATGLTIAGLPPGLVEPAMMLNAALGALQENVPSQKTFAFGGRWDFARNFSLKVQLDQVNLESGSAGTLINLQPGFQPGGDVTVFSTSVDFVF